MIPSITGIWRSESTRSKSYPFIRARASGTDVTVVAEKTAVPFQKRFPELKEPRFVIDAQESAAEAKLATGT